MEVSSLPSRRVPCSHHTWGHPQICHCYSHSHPITSSFTHVHSWDTTSNSVIPSWNIYVLQGTISPITQNKNPQHPALKGLQYGTAQFTRDIQCKDRHLKHKEPAVSAGITQRERSDITLARWAHKELAEQDWSLTVCHMHWDILPSFSYKALYLDTHIYIRYIKAKTQKHAC